MSAKLLHSMASSTTGTTTSTSRRQLVGKLHRHRTILLVCDMQERFRTAIPNFESILRTTKYLTSVAQTLGIPIVVSQQYTKAFGPTVPECFADPNVLVGTPPPIPVVEKKLFSMLTDEMRTILNRIETEQQQQQPPPPPSSTAIPPTPFPYTPSYILVGIEAHVCLQQTCLDLLEEDKDVHVIVDAVSSQNEKDRDVAFGRMQQSGAFLTTAQSAAFMLTQSADDPLFKQISKLTIEHMNAMKELE